ncbi:MAG: NUDIX hydrolase [Snowella sp.]|nr:NUDIX hydrolase [Snowella sp.]
MESHEPWTCLGRLVEIRSPWLTVIGETLETDQQQVVEYWRVEKADSVIILPIQGDRLLLPKPMYRPGLGQTTLDFPGGRVDPKTAIADIAFNILERELGIMREAIEDLRPLNQTGWAVNSSFSNQKLYGYTAQIKPSYPINPSYLGVSYEINPVGIQQLLTVLSCLQCRAVLLEWWTNYLLNLEETRSPST